MLAFASSVHAARAAAAAHDAVATFGKVIVAPNGANAIPSAVQAWLDARAADEATLTALVEEITAEAQRARRDRRCRDSASSPSRSPRSCEFPEGPRARLHAALARLGDVPVLPTAAGHDAGILSAQGADRNAVRAQPDRGLALARRVRRDGRLQSGCDGAGRRHGGLGVP